METFIETIPYVVTFLMGMIVGLLLSLPLVYYTIIKPLK